MQCDHLRKFSAASGCWSISYCAVQDRPYLPSLAELRKCCTTAEHGRCGYFSRQARRAVSGMQQAARSVQTV